MLEDLKLKIDGLLKIAVAGVIAAAAATVAFFCFAVALFLWMQQTYGTLEAWLTLGALFVGIAALAGITILIVRNRKRRTVRAEDKRRREQPSMASRMLQDPTILLTGLQVVRTLGVRNILPVVLLGAVAGGLLMGRNGHAHRIHDDELDNRGVPAE